MAGRCPSGTIIIRNYSKPSDNRIVHNIVRSVIECIQYCLLSSIILFNLLLYYASATM